MCIVFQMHSAHLRNYMVGYVISISIVRNSTMVKIQNIAFQRDRFCPKQLVEEVYELTLNKERCVWNSSHRYRTSVEMYECSSPFLSVLQALIRRLHCFRLRFNFGPIYFKKGKFCCVLWHTKCELTVTSLSIKWNTFLTLKWHGHTSVTIQAKRK